jgi:hypothetical protein
MSETIKDCRCIDAGDKHELSKAVLTRIAIYQDAIKEEDTEEIIKNVTNLKKGEIEIRHTKKITQYKDIINRLYDLYKRLENTQECK